MKIKFYEVLYPLHDAPNVSPSHFQASVSYSGETLASIISEAESSTQIDVYDDEDNLTATYRNYTDFVAINYIPNEDPVVSVEFSNTDMQAQLDALAREVEEIQRDTEPLVITIPATSGTTTAYHDDRIRGDMTVVKVEDTKTGYAVNDVLVEVHDGLMTINNVTNVESLRVTLI